MIRENTCCKGKVGDVEGMRGNQTQGNNPMTTFKATLNVESTNNLMTIGEARTEAVGAAILIVAQLLKTESLTRELAVKTLKPIMDSVTGGDKGKGRSELITRLTQDNLDAALASLDEPAKTVSTTKEK